MLIILVKKMMIETENTITAHEIDKDGANMITNVQITRRVEEVKQGTLTTSDEGGALNNSLQRGGSLNEEFMFFVLLLRRL